MQSPGPNASCKSRGQVHLHDRVRQFPPTRACNLGDVAILVRHGPDRAENHAVDRLGSELALLVDRRLLGNKLVAADNIRDFGKLNLCSNS